MKQSMHCTTGGAEWIQNSVKKAFFYKGSDSPNAYQIITHCLILATKYQ